MAARAHREVGMAYAASAQGEAGYPDAPLHTLLDAHPEMDAAAGAVIAAYHTIAAVQHSGGCLFLCGNGGSMADALHISAEMLKSYTLRRPLGRHLTSRLREAGPDGPMLSQVLERGLRAAVLGLNHSLGSALENDVPTPAIAYAQELLVLARPADALLAISTSGNARNVCYAAQVARALGLPVIAMTGQDGGQLATLAAVPIRVPARRTDRVQEILVAVYHCLCEMLETHFFAE